MSDVFRQYSQYYDLLYKDKDYAGESHYIQSLLTRFSDNPKRLLELGSGTGKHAAALACAGYDLTCVEQSHSMIAAAEQLAFKQNQKSAGSMQVIEGDARTVRLNSRFDGVMSLFHVVSYQATNADVAAIFETSSIHLRDGGVFIFDVWYGPAVLIQQPEVRVKRMEDDFVSILRIAEPQMNVNQNIVRVDYTVLATSKSDSSIQTINETHYMRYFFLPELSQIAEAHSMQVIHSEEWATAKPPSASSWGVTVVARKHSESAIENRNPCQMDPKE